MILVRMQDLLRATCRLLSTFLGATLVVGGAAPALSAPVSCPTTGSGGSLVWVCTLSDGATSIQIEAPGSVAPGTEEFVDWIVAGEHLLFLESAFLFSGTPGSLTLLSPTVQGATADTATGEVAISLAQAGTFDLLVSYQLQQTADGAQVVKTVVLTPGPGGLSGRLYSYHDFDVDLSLSPSDTSEATAADTLVQRGVASFPNLELFAMDLPDGWQIEDASSVTTTLVDRLAGGEAVVLDDTQGVVGPGDIASAFSWDFNQAANDPLTIRLRQTLVMVPEPGSTLLAWSACLVLAAARRSQRSSRVPRR
jgi:hypothetical protein